MHFHVIIPCYNRPQSLRRLLRSLLQSQVLPGDQIDITFSVDGLFPATEEVIQQFQWPWGKTQMIVHPNNQGIKKHMFSCLELGIKHNWNIVLEDDLWASPILWTFLHQHLQNIQNLGYHSLALYQQPYYPSNLHLRLDSQDSFQAVQYPCSSGYLISGQNLAEFLAWKDLNLPLLTPSYMNGWTDSWKKIYAGYLIEHDKYVLYPPASIVTNFGDAGAHHQQSSRFFQSPLMLVANTFHLDTVPLKYDVYFNLMPDEVKRLIPELGSLEFDVDLTGDKLQSELNAPYLLSVRPCSRPMFQWSDELKPLERNLQFNLNGHGIQFGKTSDFDFIQKLDHSQYLESVIPPRWNKFMFNHLLTEVFKLRKLYYLIKNIFPNS